MERLYVFILRNDVWIYIICVLGLFWYVGELWRASRSRRVAVFGLERERSQNQLNNALFFVAILSIIGGAVLFVNVRIAPTLPADLLVPPTLTPDIFRTPLASPTPLSSPVPSPPPALVPTITLPSPGNSPVQPLPEETVEGETAVLEDETPTPGPTPTPLIECSFDLNIIDPRDGATVAGTLVFTGTADTDLYGGYQLEINGPQTNGQWSSLLGRIIPNRVREGILGDANLSQWESGPYLIRLTAVDPDGNPTNICVIQVTLLN